MTGASVFHEGEQEIQRLQGVRQSSEALGQKMLRKSMTAQHQEFFNNLPLLFAATLDESGRPWASILEGEEGFLDASDPFLMKLSKGLGEHDPGRFASNQPIGLLGLDFRNRRRNRMNGVLQISDDGQWEVHVRQAYGNCPQFIQTRQLVSTKERLKPSAKSSRKFDDQALKQLKETDTFFIASAHSTQGLDLSHRGGWPGFVKVTSDNSFLWPDFSGNNMYNTVGNILTEPKTGYLFIDFESRTLLQLTGRTTIISDPKQVAQFPGAERLMSFQLDEMVRLEDALAFQWEFEEHSWALGRVGDWSGRDKRAYEVISKVPEAEEIISLRLRPVEGDVPRSLPGQHLAIEVAEGKTRTYSISSRPGDSTLRISVKKQPSGKVSGHIHEKVRVGDRVWAYPPQGQFVVKRDRPTVFLSAGIGITPLLPMAWSRVEKKIPTWFLHGDRNKESQPFAQELWQLERAGARVHIRHSRPTTEDGYQSTGRLDKELLQSLFPSHLMDFYLCGPAPFLKEMRRILGELGVPPEAIFWESFGGADVSGPAVDVQFSKSKKTSKWNSGTLLEQAENDGLNPPSGCRSGACGACKIPLLRGRVRYQSQPLFPVDDGDVLLCQALPAEGAEEPLVIEL